MSKRHKKQKKIEFPVNEQSTRETFNKWLDECGIPYLSNFNDILSCCGSDGPDIKEKKLDKVPFNQPEAIEKYLVDYGYYEEDDVLCGQCHYIPPKVHYIDWFRKNYPEN